MKFEAFLSLVAGLFMVVFNGHAQRKEIRKAENALYNEEYYIAKKLLEKAEPKLEDQGSGLKGRYYLAKGDVYLGLYSGEISSLDGIKIAENSFKKAKKYKKEEAKDGLKAIERFLVERSLKHQSEEDYLHAYEHIYAAYQLNPKDTLYLFAAAENAYEAERFDEAIPFYNELRSMGFKANRKLYSAIEKDSDIKRVFSNKEERDIMVESGYYKNPSDTRLPSVEAELLKKHALAYIKNYQEEKGWAVIDQAKKEHPNNFEFKKADALVHLELENTEEFLQIIHELIDENPDDSAEYYGLLGDQAFQNEQPQKAVEFYKKALEFDPELSAAHKNIAGILVEDQERVKEEMEELKKSKDDLGRYSELQDKRLNLLEEALAHLEKAYKYEPENTGLIQMLYQLNALLNHKDKAKKYAEIIKKME